MANDLVKKTATPLTAFRGAVHGALRIPRKIVAAVKRFTQAASRLVNRLLANTTGRPARPAATTHADLPALPAPKFPAACLQSLRSQAQKGSDSDLLEIHDNFLRSSGKLFTEADKSRLGDAAQTGKVMYDKVVTSLISQYERLEETSRQDWIQV